MGICEVLTIIFVMCKLFGIITWSWWLVLLPEIVAVFLYVFIFILHIIVCIKAKKGISKLWED